MTDETQAADLKEERKRKKYNYHNSHFKTKIITFSTTSGDDMEVLTWLDEQPNISGYIRGLIKADMERVRSEKDQEPGE